MSKPIWFPFYPGDFLASSRVAMMTTEEIGGYLLLLCHCWQDPTCTIPADDDAVRKLSRLTGSLEVVKSCFILKRGRLLNERLYKEWKKVKEKSELAKKSIEVRWKNERNTNVKRTLYSSHRNIGTEEESEKKEEKKPQRASMTDDEWITDLQRNPAYTHINFPVELGRMDAWLALPKNKGRQRTRRFVLNWLNKIERPMSGNGTVKTQAAIPPFPGPEDPIGRNLWRQAYGNPR